MTSHLKASVLTILLALSASACAVDTRDIMNDGPEPNTGSGGSKSATGGSDPGSGGADTGSGGLEGTGGGNATGGSPPANTGGNDSLAEDWPCRDRSSYAEPTDPDASLLDDMEHPFDFSFYTADFRYSTWTAQDDGSTGTNSANSGPIYPTNIGTEAAPDFVNIFEASGYTSWGAVATLALNQDDVPPFYECAHDLSAWTGIAFDIRGTEGSGGKNIAFGVLTEEVMPIELGGRCLGGCLATHLAEFPLPAEWQRYEVPFSDLNQYYLSPSDQIPFEPAHAVRLEFQIFPGSNLGFQIDNVTLY